MSLNFSPSVLTKARKYVKTGALTQSEGFPNVWHVRGSSARPYRVQVNTSDGAVTMATCSCDFGTQTGAGWSTCSHVAAVLMAIKRRGMVETSHQRPKTADSTASGPKSGGGTASKPAGPPNAKNPNDTFDPAWVTWIMEPKDLTKLWRALGEATEIVIDLETTGLDPHATGQHRDWPESARISMAALTLPREGDDEHTVRTYVLPLSHPEGPMRGVWRMVAGQLVDRMHSSGLPIVNQNLKFDLRWLYAFRPVDLSPQFSWDTQIGAHLLDENSSTRLKEVAPATFGIERWDDHDLSTPAASERVPIFELGLYAARDTYWTWRLAKHQRWIMNTGPEADPGTWPTDPVEEQEFRLGTLSAWCAMPTSATLTGIEQLGLRVDVGWIKEHIEEEQVRFEEHFSNLVDRYPVDPDREPSFAPTSIWFREWTQAAVGAGDLEVIQMTENGNPQWNKSVLKRLDANGSPIAGALLEMREAEKRLQYLRAWLPMITPFGTIHTTYHAGRVVTGRLSSSDPNVQQITRALKPAFIPREGRLMAELDLSQIELRVAAYVSRSEPMINAYRAGEDLHRALGARISGTLPEDVSGEQRQRAKAGNFGFLYGMSAEGFRHYALDSYDVVFTEEEALEIRAHFFEEWEGIAEWHTRMVERGKRDGFVTSPIGRVRRLPNLQKMYGGGDDERKAINSPVQGFASDLMQIAAATIAGNLPTHSPVIGAHLVGTVHDSILVEVPEDGWEDVVDECMSRMVNLNPVLRNMGCTLDVPLAVEASVGTRWGLGDVGTRELTGSA